MFAVQRPENVEQQYHSAGQTLQFLGLSAKQSKDGPTAATQKLLGLGQDTMKQ